MKPPEQNALEGIDNPVGVFRAIRALGDYKLKDALWPEVTMALILGAGGSIFIVRATTVVERVGVMGNALALAGVLLAVTFAALAFVVSIPSGSYLRMLGETKEGGMRRFLDPFLLAVGVQIGLVLLAFAYRIFAVHVPDAIEHIAFGVGAFLLVFALFDIAGLARQLVRHGVLRAIDSTLSGSEDENSASVHRLPGQRGK